MSPAGEEIGPVETGLRPLAGVADAGLQPLPARAGGKKCLGEAGARREPDIELGHRHGVRIKVADRQSLAGRPLPQFELDPEKGQAGAAAFVGLEKGQAGPRTQPDAQAGGVGAIAPGHLSQDNRPLAARFDLHSLWPRAVRNDDGLPADPVKRAGADRGRIKGKRGLRDCPQQAPEVRPAPVLVPPRRQEGGIAQPYGLVEVHAALAYLS